MDKYEPSTIKQRRFWSGLKAADGIMAAFNKRNAQLLQPHNPRERICGQRLTAAPSAKADTPPKRGMAFTLAEVLITLSIIGVVAALTIPTLVQRTGNEELVSRLMKTYSTLSQATEMIMTENGSPKAWVTSLDSFYEAYKAHLRNAQECGTKTGCWTQSQNGGLKQLNGKPDDNWDSLGFRNLVLSDGTQVGFTPAGLDPSCKTRCGLIHVDINGQKKPNQQGRDVFTFELKESGLFPFYCDEGFTACKLDGRGLGCACKVIAEGAMNY